jgi:hypothetical protein
VEFNHYWSGNGPYPPPGDAVAEHDTYDENVISEYPQSGERIHGRRNLQALRGHHPEKPSGFAVRRILGAGYLWVTDTPSTTKAKTSLSKQ